MHMTTTALALIASLCLLTVNPVHGRVGRRLARNTEQEVARINSERKYEGAVLLSLTDDEEEEDHVGHGMISYHQNRGNRGARGHRQRRYLQQPSQASKAATGMSIKGNSTSIDDNDNNGTDMPSKKSSKKSVKSQGNSTSTDDEDRKSKKSGGSKKSTKSGGSKKSGSKKSTKSGGSKEGSKKSTKSGGSKKSGSKKSGGGSNCKKKKSGEGGGEPGTPDFGDSDDNCPDGDSDDNGNGDGDSDDNGNGDGDSDDSPPVPPATPPPSTPPPVPPLATPQPSTAPPVPQPSTPPPTTPPPVPPPATPQPSTVPPVATPAPTASGTATTPMPSTTATFAPTPTGSLEQPTVNRDACTDNPQNFVTSLDVQLSFPDGIYEECDSGREAEITFAITEILNDKFGEIVSDWMGQADFTTFYFDDAQLELNVPPEAGNVVEPKRQVGGPGGDEDEPICPSRDSVPCTADACRWGCVVVETTDCGTSTVTNWGKLAPYVRDRLARIARLQGITCLGDKDGLSVVMRVANERGSFVPTPVPVVITRAPTPEPIAVTRAPSPEPTASTPEPTESTPEPTVSTDSPTAEPTTGTAAPNPSPVASPPTPGNLPTVPQCEDNPMDYNVNLDIQIQYNGNNQPTCTADQITDITDKVSAVLNDKFPDTVSDWDGTADFGSFILDAKQEVTSSSGRGEFGTCPSREKVTCEKDLCKWGCVTASTTDCGTSSLVNWRLLADDVKDRLGNLGYPCLGNKNQMMVVLVVDDPNGGGYGGPDSTPRSGPVLEPEPAPAPAPEPATTTTTTTEAPPVNDFSTTAKVDSNERAQFGFPKSSGDNRSQSSGVCTEHSVVYDVALDLQIKYAGNTVETCDLTQQGTINAEISAEMNNKFTTRVPEWNGLVGFGSVTFDSKQTVDKKGGGRRELLSDNEGRSLEETKCDQKRGLECKKDYCRWACLSAPTTSCGGVNSLTNWVGLEDDVREKLKGLGYPCLGIKEQLEVNMVINDPTAGTGSVTRSFSADSLVQQAEMAERISQAELDSLTEAATPDVDLTGCKDLEVNSWFTFEFFKNKGRLPTATEVAELVTNTENYIETRLAPVSEFAGLICDVQLRGVVPDYDPSNPDVIPIHVKINVFVKDSSTATAAQALHTIAGSNWKTYIGEYVRDVQEGTSNDFYNTFKVHYKGSAPKHLL